MQWKPSVCTQQSSFRTPTPHSACLPRHLPAQPPHVALGGSQRSRRLICLRAKSPLRKRLLRDHGSGSRQFDLRSLPQRKTKKQQTRTLCFFGSELSFHIEKSLSDSQSGCGGILVVPLITWYIVLEWYCSCFCIVYHPKIGMLFRKCFSIGIVIDIVSFICHRKRRQNNSRRVKQKKSNSSVFIVTYLIIYGEP